ncbi:MAG: hypothetical protein RLZZ383_882 [Pseudomonadota bacterium]|jgi:hypothetical protein
MSSTFKTSRRTLLRGAASAGALSTLPGVAGCDVDEDTAMPGADVLEPHAFLPPTVHDIQAPAVDTTLGPYDLTGMPFRQDDPTWGSTLMWDRALVIRAATELNGFSPIRAAGLLRRFPDGNNIANEGCQLTCFAMILKLLDPNADAALWTPKRLNSAAQAMMYYTLSGLSMTTLYGDVVSDVTLGRVQLAIKEEYLPGVRQWPQVFCSTSPLVRAYRRLPLSQRADMLLMLKTGTYDDTVASHYVLLHPHDEGAPDDDNVTLLDPAMPFSGSLPWRLSDSAAWITGDPGIGRAWEQLGIDDTQIGGVWVFLRLPETRSRAALAPLLALWAEELGAVG